MGPTFFVKGVKEQQTICHSLNSILQPYNIKVITAMYRWI